VAEVARAFGGGGHKNAAGCNFETSLEEAEELLVEEMRRCLESS
jgi:phosphoesterase RecJ-like protein